MYTFNLSIGDVNTKAFAGMRNTNSVSFLYIFCVIINLIVMLNLIISIISKTYE